jgi:hypothetical protein
MQISNSIGQGGYTERDLARLPRPAFSAKVEEQAARRNSVPVSGDETATSQSIPSTEAAPLLPPPSTRPQTIDEIFVRGRLMDHSSETLTTRLAIARYTEVAAQPERFHIAEVLGVDAYA